MTGQYLEVTVTPDILLETIEFGIDPADPDSTPMTFSIGVTVAMILTEVSLTLFIIPHDKVHPDTEAKADTTTAGTHHTTNPHHTGVSLEITVGPEHDQTNTTTNLHPHHLQGQDQQTNTLGIEGTNKLQLMTHHWNIIAQMNMTVIWRMI